MEYVFLDNIFKYIFNNFQSSQHYTNLKESFLELQLQFLKQDDGEVAHRDPLDSVSNTFPKGADFGAVPINNIAHSLFSSAELTLNDNVLCSEPIYAYKAQLQSLFTYSNESKKSWLQDLSGWRYIDSFIVFIHILITYFACFLLT